MTQTVSSAMRKSVTKVVGGKRLSKGTHSNTFYKEQERFKEDHESEIQCVNKEKYYKQMLKYQIGNGVMSEGSVQAVGQHWVAFPVITRLV